MIFGNNKKGNTAEEMQNWYQDRYTAVAIQRNFLLFFSIFVAIALLICLIIVKKLQEGAASDPYLIEYDKVSGFMTIVEAQSKKEYTAQQAVKESMVLQYITKREAPNLQTIEEDMNYIRVNTAAKIYQDYLTDVGNNIRKLKQAGINPKYEIIVKAIQYLAANRLLVTITKNTLADGVQTATMDYKITITFGFIDMEAPIEDMRINPLGFQVSYYRALEVKTFRSAVMQDKKENKDDSNHSSVNTEYQSNSSPNEKQ